MNVAKQHNNITNNLDSLHEWEKDFYSTIILDIRRQFKDVKVKIDTTVNETYVFRPEQVEIVAMLLKKEKFSVIDVKDNGIGYTIYVKKDKK